MADRPRVALLGDRGGHRSHRELDALRPALAVDTEWVATGSGFDATAYDGVWLVPGSPYADDDAVLAALAVVREREVPFLGTCGGMQYAVLELARSLMFQPHVGALAGQPVHPVVTAFTDAVGARVGA